VFIFEEYHIDKQKPNDKNRKRENTMFQVRTKEWEKKNWKVVATFETWKEAHTFAIKEEYKNRRNPEKMFDYWDIKNTETKERMYIAYK
jgi:hypothetical protein